MAAKLRADLPQYVVLRSKDDGNCLQYLWDEEQFGDVYKCMATKTAVDPVSPFTKLVIVPSPATGDYIYLRSAYNNKYIKPVKLNGIYFLSATADTPNDDMGLVGTSTLFEAFTPSNLPNTVWFRYAVSQYPVYIANIPKSPVLDKVACLYSNDRAYTTYFEYAAWESYEDKMSAKDGEIRSRDVEIRNLKDQVAAKDVEIGSRDVEIRELKEQVVGKDGDIAKLKEKVAAWEAYEEERKEKLEEEMKKLQSAWDSFQVDVRAGIDPSA